jgi:hypothetical protein
MMEWKYLYHKLYHYQYSTKEEEKYGRQIRKNGTRNFRVYGRKR